MCLLSQISFGFIGTIVSYKDNYSVITQLLNFTSTVGFSSNHFGKTFEIFENLKGSYVYLKDNLLF